MSKPKTNSSWLWRVSIAACVIVAVIDRNLTVAVCIVAITIAHYSEGEKP